MNNRNKIIINNKFKLIKIKIKLHYKDLNSSNRINKYNNSKISQMIMIKK